MYNTGSSEEKIITPNVVIFKTIIRIEIALYISARKVLNQKGFEVCLKTHLLASRHLSYY